MSLPDAVRQACAPLLDGATILEVKSLSGGDINQARLLITDHGRYFLKMNNRPFAHRMFEAEEAGLEQLQEHIRTPKVLGREAAGEWAFLLLEYIEEGKRTPDFWVQFGQALAEVHQHSAGQFGLEYDNYIGSLDQSNQQRESWLGFYQSQRLEPQVRMAMDKGLLWSTASSDFERIYVKLGEICPEEPPALIHGDLWGGNFLTTSNGQAALIDPAVCYAHREMDLAMSRLFGGFSQLFYESYQEHYPTAPGLEARLDIYQLYYLLVHVNLFGRSYTSAVKRIVEKYG